MPEATCEISNADIGKLPGIKLIAETLDRLRDERGELENFLESVFAAMEDIGTGLSRRQGHLAEQEAKLNEREEQLAQRQQEQANLHELLQAQASQLETMGTQLQSVREGLGKQLSAQPSDAGDGHLQGIVQKLEEQRDDLKQRLDVCREELARRSDATEQLAKTQTELASAREELFALREKIASAAEHGPDDAEGDRERVALETELEMVRRRAAELSETLAEQKDQMAQQQAIWSAELNHLRRLMDAHNGAWINQNAQPAPAAEVAPPPTGAAPPQQPAASDPVVGSVMQQFAMLQKDVAQRRNRNKP